MRMLKKWSKSGILLRTTKTKLFEFWQSLTQPQTSRNSSNEQKNTLEYHFETCNSPASEKWECWKSGQNLKFEGSKFEKFHNCGCACKISDFDHFFITFDSDLWVNCKSQNGCV